jgi:hypothetical protein
MPVRRGIKGSVDLWALLPEYVQDGRREVEIRLRAHHCVAAKCERAHVQLLAGPPVVRPHAEPIHAVADVALVHASVDQRKASAVAVVDLGAAVALRVDERCEKPGIDVELQAVPNDSLCVAFELAGFSRRRAQLTHRLREVGRRDSCRRSRLVGPVRQVDQAASARTQAQATHLLCGERPLSSR